MLGDKFTQWNPLTERLEYLHVEQSMVDVFTRKWAMLSTSKVVGKALGEGGAAKEEDGQQKKEELESGLQKKEKPENGLQGEQGHGLQKKGEQLEAGQHAYM
jgi:hypothetical protein